jgi:asparagine synthase (glutamine-hydrolysing)
MPLSPTLLEYEPGPPAERWSLFFDGRLDNRDELARELGLGQGASDREIVLGFLTAGRWEALDRFLGPWALSLVDHQARETHLARDPTGERMLCWHADRERLAVASDPADLLTDPDVPRDLDEATLAAFFALRQPEPDATFFRAIRQVPPGHHVVLSAAGERRYRFWNPDLSLLQVAEDEAVELFRERIGLAVRDSLQGAGPAAVLLSGGLDSTTVAAHAARLSPARLRAVSWRFRELAEADESEYAQAVMSASGLDPIWVDADGCWPLRDLDPQLRTFDVDPAHPFENPLRELHAATYETAAAAGVRTLFTGHFSDEMYQGVDAWWLRDSLALPDPHAIVAGVRGEIRWRSRPDVWTPGLRRALGVLFLGTGWERLRSRRVPDWLTPHARERLRRPAALLPDARRPEQAETLLAPFALMGIAAERRRARQHGIELRFPFRDRRLIELALRVPAHYLARPGWRKRLVWLAGEGWLPDEVRLRRRSTDLSPLVARLEPFLDTSTGLPAQVFWHCLIAEMWARQGA